MILLEEQTITLRQEFINYILNTSSFATHKEREYMQFCVHAREILILLGREWRKSAPTEKADLVGHYLDVAFQWRSGHREYADFFKKLNQGDLRERKAQFVSWVTEAIKAKIDAACHPQKVYPEHVAFYFVEPMPLIEARPLRFYW
jgi:hypothetical protein